MRIADGSGDDDLLGRGGKVAAAISRESGDEGAWSIEAIRAVFGIHCRPLMIDGDAGGGTKPKKRLRGQIFDRSWSHDRSERNNVVSTLGAWF